jgi:uncharacterized membrane protein
LNARAVTTGLVFAVVTLILLARAGSAGAAPTPTLSVTVSQTEAVLKAGEQLKFTSTIANSGEAATPPLVTNLNLVAVGGSFVDPEDWSPDRFATVDPIAPGGSARQDWTVHAIQGGDYSVFIVVLPDTTTRTGSDTVVGSQAIHLHVDETGHLNPGGVTPISIAVPLVLGLALISTRVVGRRRSARRRTAE